ncbi:hypothetical protein RUND412_003084 [Rhizina undulata]
MSQRFSTYEDKRGFAVHVRLAFARQEVSIIEPPPSLSPGEDRKVTIVLANQNVGGSPAPGTRHSFPIPGDHPLNGYYIRRSGLQWSITFPPLEHRTPAATD